MEAIERKYGRHLLMVGDFQTIPVDDDFKSVNRARGHQIGDADFKKVRRMAICVRPYDTVGRPGSEQRVIVARSWECPATPKPSDRAPSAIRSMPIECAGYSVAARVGCRIPLKRHRNLLEPGPLLRLMRPDALSGGEAGSNGVEFAEGDDRVWSRQP
jgi:GGDEF domain-containing protein